MGSTAVRASDPKDGDGKDRRGEGSHFTRCLQSKAVTSKMWVLINKNELFVGSNVMRLRSAAARSGHEFGEP